MERDLGIERVRDVSNLNWRGLGEKDEKR